MRGLLLARTRCGTDQLGSQQPDKGWSDCIEINSNPIECRCDWPEIGKLPAHRRPNLHDRKEECKDAKKEYTHHHIDVIHNQSWVADPIEPFHGGTSSYWKC